ncbi:TetR/AcrR family transcriptional regulator [Neptuniibacter halophilus]|uniref:TetR/AcrR family transcriptional regulator n=1 Tax=Neptuniibacter halophilus TaxID=651666 RepID=UPI0025747296|nr:TetR/AcrR family transcriptional regulator [Neptuniibacter halophilus]
MTNTKKTYHHGDLRGTLLAAATDIIAEGGVESLSIRRLADRVGVSRTAPYHHFKDKNALLCAIAEQGFEQQDALVESIAANPDQLTARELFERYVLTYIRFADEQKETYDLMYGRDIWKSGAPTESLQQISKNCFRNWLKWVEVLQQQGIFDPEQPTLRVAQSSWAALHGLCRLFNDGIYLDRADIDEIARNSVQMLIRQP